jgi:hypothetical protein
MGKKCGQQSINFSQPPVITSGANIVGPEEGEGPLASGFDWILDDPLFGEKSWEMAECKMLEESAKLALQKIELQTQDVDFFLAGDLLNQIISSNYAARGLEIPFFGLYGACSTFVEALLRVLPPDLDNCSHSGNLTQCSHSMGGDFVLHNICSYEDPRKGARTSCGSGTTNAVS